MIFRLIQEMRLFSFFIIVGLILNSCKEPVQESSIDKKVEKVIVFDKKYVHDFDSKDADCMKEYKRAIRDIENNKLVFAEFGIFQKYEDEFIELLKKDGIEYDFLGENCTGLSNCYGYCMDSVICKRFGENYIQKLLKKAHEISDSRWKSKVYNYFEVDENAIYPNTNDAVQVEDILLKEFILPKDWKYGKMKNNERECVSIKIVVDQNGKAQTISNELFMYNIKPENRRYMKYLKDELKRVIEEMKLWKPAIINGHKVKSEEYIDITFN
jgi:hypothetical protein